MRLSGLFEYGNKGSSVGTWLGVVSGDHPKRRYDWEG